MRASVINKLSGLHWSVFIIVAILWRILLVFLFSSAMGDIEPDRVITPGFGHIANDYIFLVRPAENLYTSGEYSFREGVPFAGRMPGYAVIYLFYRLMLSAEMSLLMLVITQAVLGGLGVYALARAASDYFEDKRAFFIAFALGMLYPASAFFDFKTIAEGLAISLLSIGFYFLIRAIKTFNWLHLIFSGILIAWVVFLRPYLGVLLPLFALFMLFQFRGSIVVRLKYVVIWSLPFVLALGAWNVRNYKTFDKVILLQASAPDSYGKMYGRAWLDIRNMIGAWGGIPVFYEPGSEGEWFRMNRSDAPLQLPEKVYAAGCFSADDLVNLKQDYQGFHYNPGFDSTLSKSISARASAYAACYRAQLSTPEKMGMFVMRGVKVVARSGSGYMPPIYPLWLEKPVRLALGAMYYFILLAWVAACLYYRRLFLWLVPPALLLFSLLWVSIVVENRYFMTIFSLGIFVVAGAFIKSPWFKKSPEATRE